MPCIWKRRALQAEAEAHELRIKLDLAIKLLREEEDECLGSGTVISMDRKPCRSATNRTSSSS